MYINDLKEHIYVIYSKYKKNKKKKKKEQEAMDKLNRNPELKQALDANKIFYNKYNNQRCFVIGNGPSLNHLDLSILQGEYTFTVNQITRRKDFPDLKTNFHFWADPAFFRIDVNKPEDLELLNVMKSVDTSDNHPIVFFPYEQKRFAEQFDLEAELNIYYYESRGGLESEDIDYSNFVPGFHTVVQYCITMAIFMGFKEIYLLGCDNTSLINTIKSAADLDVDEYGYFVSDNEKKRIKSLFKYHSLYDYVYSYLTVLKDYEKLNKYCNSRSIKLINCTKHSAIDCLLKKDINEILFN